MARAAYFMQGGGGYSYLVAGAVHELGGIVICYTYFTTGPLVPDLLSLASRGDISEAYS